MRGHVFVPLHKVGFGFVRTGVKDVVTRFGDSTADSCERIMGALLRDMGVGSTHTGDLGRIYQTRRKKYSIIETYGGSRLWGPVASSPL